MIILKINRINGKKWNFFKNIINQEKEKKINSRITINNK